MRIRRHFRYVWSRSLSLSVGESEIIGGLSTPLRAEALRHMHRALIAENPIFRLVDDPTFRDGLIRCLRPSLVSPGALARALAPDEQLELGGAARVGAAARLQDGGELRLLVSTT